MADHSLIEWTHSTWNPVTGCTEVSEGCDLCYARVFAERWRGVPGHPYEQGFDLRLWPERLDRPLRWRRPRMIFVTSMGDLFHEGVPDQFIAQVFAVMAATPWHTYQVLTKRHARMRTLLSSEVFQSLVARTLMEWAESTPGPPYVPEHLVVTCGQPWWPLANVWGGVSVETQRWAEIRIPELVRTPLAVRFLSCEPLLDMVDLSRWLWLSAGSTAGPFRDHAGRVRHVDGAGNRLSTGGIGGQTITHTPARDLHWVIAGGESGTGGRELHRKGASPDRRRPAPMHPAWPRLLRDQCVEAEVPFFFKQWGSWVENRDEAGELVVPDRPTRGLVALHTAGMTALESDNPFNPFAAGHPNWTVMRRVRSKTRAGRELDGRTWDEFPAAVPAIRR